MIKNLKCGLLHFLTDDFFNSLQNPESINILSIGCMRDLSVFKDEMTHLIECGRKKKINYTGINLTLFNESIIESAFNAPKNTQHQFHVLEHDVNDLTCFSRIKSKPFDLVLLRHPAFFDPCEKVMKQILRTVIPAVLKDNGLLLVSLYDKSLGIYLGEGVKTTIDKMVLKIIYSHSQYFENSSQMENRYFQSSVIIELDQLIYCLKNKINTQENPKNNFQFMNDINTQLKNNIFNLVKAMGGEIINPDKNIFSLWDCYVVALKKELQEYGDITFHKITNSSDFFVETNNFVFSPISDLHSELIEKIKKLKNIAEKNDYDVILNTLTKKNYNQALRQAAVKANDFTSNVMEILLDKGEELNLSPTECNSKNKSAIDYATQCNHPRLSSLQAYAAVNMHKDGSEKEKIAEHIKEKDEKINYLSINMVNNLKKDLRDEEEPYSVISGNVEPNINKELSEESDTKNKCRSPDQVKEKTTTPAVKITHKSSFFDKARHVMFKFGNHKKKSENNNNHNVPDEENRESKKITRTKSTYNLKQPVKQNEKSLIRSISTQFDRRLSIDGGFTCVSSKELKEIRKKAEKKSQQDSFSSATFFRDAFSGTDCKDAVNVGPNQYVLPDESLKGKAIIFNGKNSKTLIDSVAAYYYQFIDPNKEVITKKAKCEVRTVDGKVRKILIPIKSDDGKITLYLPVDNRDIHKKSEHKKAKKSDAKFVEFNWPEKNVTTEASRLGLK